MLDTSCDILLIGAGGFLGTEIFHLARETGVRCRCSYYRHFIPSESNTGALLLDIRNLDQVKRATENTSVIINVAGLAHVFEQDNDTLRRFREVNEYGAANVAMAAVSTGVRHVVLVSSVAVYGRGECQVDETLATCTPHSEYGQSKFAGERLATQIVRGTNTSLTILRPTTLYGENDRGNLMRLIRTIDRRRFIWVGCGANRKSLIYRNDAARACLTTALRPPLKPLNVYNVSAYAPTMKEIVEAISAALDKPAPVKAIPSGLALGTSKLAARLAGRGGMFGMAEATLMKWLSDEVYDGSRFQHAYRFQPLVDLQEGIRRQVSWYKRSLAPTHR